MVCRVTIVFRGTYHGEMIVEFLHRRTSSGLLTTDPDWNGSLIGE